MSERIPATSGEICALAKQMLDFAYGKLVKKNRKYGSVTDGLANLRHCEEFGVSTELGIIVRMADKMQRIHREAMEPAIPPDYLGRSEQGIDNNDLPDLINYCALLYAVRHKRTETNNPKPAMGTSCSALFPCPQCVELDQQTDAFERGIDHPSDSVGGIPGRNE
jgi:hypothetical protein